MPRPPYHIATFRVKEERHRRPRYWWGLCPLRELLVSRALQVSRCHAWKHLKLRNTACFRWAESGAFLCFDNWVRNHSSLCELQLFSCPLPAHLPSYPVSSAAHSLISSSESTRPTVCAARSQRSVAVWKTNTTEAEKSSPVLESSPALAPTPPLCQNRHCVSLSQIKIETCALCGCLLRSLLPSVHTDVNDRCGVTYLRIYLRFIYKWDTSIRGVVSRSFAVNKTHTQTL